MDRHGVILYHPDESLIGTTVTSPRFQSVVDDYNRGTIPSSGSFEYYYDNANRIYGYSVIPEMDWSYS